MPCSVASDLGLHCLPITLLGVSRLQLARIFLLNNLMRTHEEKKNSDFCLQSIKITSTVGYCGVLFSMILIFISSNEQWNWIKVKCNEIQFAQGYG